MKKSILVGLAILFFSAFSFAQDLISEKTVQFSPEAKNDKLAHLQYDEINQTYELIYIIKAKTNAEIETYLIDKDFNLIKSDAFEIEFSKLTDRYSWWYYNGDVVTTQGISVDPKANLILKKREITGTYNWNDHKYVYKAKVMEKVKLRNEDGDRFYKISYYEDDITGGAYVLAGVKDNDDKDRQWTDIHLLKINKDIDVEKDFPFNFTNPQILMSSKVYTGNNGEITNWLFLFQNKDMSGKCTLINMSKDCEVIDNVEFKVKDATWTVEDISWHEKTGSICIYGPSGKGAFQVLKISDHKLAYNVITPITEFKDKFKRPLSQTKGDPYNGKKYFIDEADFLEDGSLIIMGQNWDYGGASNAISMIGGTGDVTPRFMDCFMFHYDPVGNLVSQYCYYTKDKGWSNDYPNSQLILPGKSGKYFYWIVMPVAQFGFSYHPTMISKIDAQKGIIEEFKEINDFPGQKGIFFHDYDFPWVDTGDGKIVFFGQLLNSQKSRKSNTVWFSKFLLE